MEVYLLWKMLLNGGSLEISKSCDATGSEGWIKGGEHEAECEGEKLLWLIKIFVTDSSCEAVMVLHFAPLTADAERGNTRNNMHTYNKHIGSWGVWISFLPL